MFIGSRNPLPVVTQTKDGLPKVGGPTVGRVEERTSTSLVRASVKVKQRIFGVGTVERILFTLNCYLKFNFY